MADIIDNASTLEDLQRDAALSMHRLNHSAVSATHCVECDEELPEARRVFTAGSSNPVRLTTMQPN